MKRKTILIAEDDRSLRKGLAFALHDLGYSITEAEDGKEAIELIQNKQFDLIISDLVMPYNDGLELYKTVQIINPAIKFLLVTSFPNDENAKEAQKLLKENYFEKSSNLENLIKRVSELLKP
ncbi:MAG: response regulator [bacterium]